MLFFLAPSGADRFFDFGDQSADEHPSMAAYKRSFSPTLIPAATYEVPGALPRRVGGALAGVVGRLVGRR